jgi:hypothetical protein
LRVMPIRKCIYCGRFFDPSRGEGDHILLAGLFGDFEGDSTFRGDCHDCNVESAIREQSLAQGSPLGYYRWIVKPNLGRRSRRGNLRQRGSRGSAPPKFTMKLGEQSILVDPSTENPTDATPLDQVVIRDESGADHYLRVFPSTTAETLRAEIARRGIGEMATVYINCSDSLAEHIKSLLASVYPSSRLISEGTADAGTSRVPGRVEFEVSIGYFQALARIAFHYYLLRNNRGFKGHEPAFTDIRRFIRYGGDKTRFFDASSRRFAIPFGETKAGMTCPKNWCHVLGADETGPEIVVYMHFFFGPRQRSAAVSDHSRPNRQSSRPAEPRLGTRLRVRAISIRSLCRQSASMHVHSDMSVVTLRLTPTLPPDSLRGVRGLRRSERSGVCALRRWCRGQSTGRGRFLQ